MNNTTPKLTTHDLHQFTGDLIRFRHTLNPTVIYTPKFIRSVAATDPHIQAIHFWKLTVGADNSGVLEARADSPCEPFVRQEIEYTDFPLEAVSIWAAHDGWQWTLYLPSEH